MADKSDAKGAREYTQPRRHCKFLEMLKHCLRSVLWAGIILALLLIIDGTVSFVGLWHSSEWYANAEIWVAIGAPITLIILLTVFRCWLHDETRSHTNEVSPTKRDGAIADYREDQYDVVNFAYQFLDSIRRANEHIVGLIGPWGSGKTSLIRVIISLLDERNIQELEKLYNPNAREIAESYQICYFSSTEIIQKGSVTEALFEKLALELTIFSGDAQLMECLPEIYGFSLQRIFVYLHNRKRKRHLQALYTRLQESQQHHIIIVDDVERLPPHDCFKVVMELANVYPLPNTTYLFAFDHRRLATSIGISQGITDISVCEQYGKAFLEKIIPYRRHLPPISLDNIISQKLNELKQLNQTEGALEINTRVLEKIRRLFSTPRDVTRFFNSIRYDVLPVIGNIDLSNFLILQVIKHRWEPIYDFIKNNRSYFLSARGYGPRYIYKSPENSDWVKQAQAERRKAIADVCSGLSDTDLDDIDELLDSLFGVGGNNPDAYTHRLISCPTYFDTYFSFTCSGDVLRPEKRKEIIEKAKDEETLRALIKENLNPYSGKFWNFFIGCLNYKLLPPETAYKAIVIFFDLPEHSVAIDKNTLLYTCLNHIRFFAPHYLEDEHIRPLFEKSKAFNLIRLLYNFIEHHCASKYHNAAKLEDLYLSRLIDFIQNKKFSTLNDAVFFHNSGLGDAILSIEITEKRHEAKKILFSNAKNPYSAFCALRCFVRDIPKTPFSDGGMQLLVAPKFRDELQTLQRTWRERKHELDEAFKGHPDLQQIWTILLEADLTQESNEGDSARRRPAPRLIRPQ